MSSSKNYEFAITWKLLKLYHCNDWQIVCQEWKPFKYKRINTDDKSYQCYHCDKYFATSGSLVSHQRTHTGDKLYQCNHCD